MVVARTRIYSANFHPLFAAALTLCFAAGCTEHVTNGNQSIYRFAWWIPPLVFAGGVIGISLGCFFRKTGGGIMALVLSPLLEAVAKPESQ